MGMSYIMAFGLMYLLIGLFVYGIGMLDWFNFENPLWRPLPFMFWPFALVYILVDILIVSWIRDVIEYYREKRKAKRK